MTTDIDKSQAVIVTHYQGLNMPQLDKLRKQMRDHGILFKITKNRITKIAIKETPVKDLEKYFSGPTAAALSSDPITTAKILTKFAKSHDKLKIIAGFMDGKVLDEKVTQIALSLSYFCNSYKATDLPRRQEKGAEFSPSPPKPVNPNP